MLKYQFIRKAHRWVGLLSSLFLIVISATGFLLAVKGSVAWMRPPVVETFPTESFLQVVGPGVAMDAAFAKNLPELQTPSDVDRVDYRPKDNVYKVLSKKGYWEVQVDGTSGRVLQVAKRNDQLTEDIHDMSFFAEFTHKWVLPVVAASLFLLGVSGIVIFLNPVFRRRAHRKNSRN